MSARTRQEFDEWVRIFSLLVKMNKFGFSVIDKNPYVFEEQQQLSQVQTPDARASSRHHPNISLSDTQGIAEHLASNRIDFGMGPLNEAVSALLVDPDIDNLKTANLGSSFDQNSSFISKNSQAGAQSQVGRTH